MRTLLLLLLAILPMTARENPFKPVIDETVLPLTSNTQEKAPPFQEVRIQLPVDARVLTSVAVYYQTLDGSIKKEIVSVDRSVDWHKPLVIRQEGAKTQKPSNGEHKAGKKKHTAAVRAKTPTHPKIAVQNTPKAKIRHHATKPRKQPAATPEYFKGEKVYKPLPFVALRFGKDFVRIVTKDPKIRVFHLANPFKIAIDFKRRAAFLTRHKTLETPPYKAVDIGNHDGYYRVVITFDAPYRYTVSKIADGYLIHLR